MSASNDTSSVTVIDHPLVQHKLTLMRRVESSSSTFRTLLREISHLLAYEVTRDLPLIQIEIETPLTKTQAPVLAGKNYVWCRYCERVTVCWKVFSN